MIDVGDQCLSLKASKAVDVYLYRQYFDLGCLVLSIVLGVILVIYKFKKGERK